MKECLHLEKLVNFNLLWYITNYFNQFFVSLLYKYYKKRQINGKIHKQFDTFHPVLCTLIYDHDKE